MSNERLRVAYILLGAPGYSETFISAEVHAVRAAGVEVELFAIRKGDGGSRLAQAALVSCALVRRPLKVFTHAFGLGPSYGARAFLAGASAVSLLRDIATFDPDIVHAHFVNLPTAVAVLTADDLGKPATATAHAADFMLERKPGALERRIRRLDHLFAVSAAAFRQLNDRGVSMSEVPHSIVRASFDGVFGATAGLGETAGRCAEGPIRLVTVARLVEKKGVDTALDAVSLLVADGLNIRYDIYGDGPLSKALAARTRLNGISSVVTFHGAVPHLEAMRALDACDVALLPCRRSANGDLDGIPVFLMEAGARGVPVVTTPVSGVTELVDHTCGWLVPPIDPEAAADAIRNVIRSPEEAALRASALRCRIRSEFSPELQVTRLIDTWRRLADST